MGMQNVFGITKCKCCGSVGKIDLAKTTKTKSYVQFEYKCEECGYTETQLYKLQSVNGRTKNNTLIYCG